MRKKKLVFSHEVSSLLVVAKSKSDEKLLEELMERGKKNGVKNLRIVGQKELREMEPYIDEKATAALYSPDAGTITPYEYTIGRWIEELEICLCCSDRLIWMILICSFLYSTC